MLTSQHASRTCHHVKHVKWVISHVNMQNNDYNMGPPFPDGDGTERWIVKEEACEDCAVIRDGSTMVRAE